MVRGLTDDARDLQIIEGSRAGLQGMEIAEALDMNVENVYAILFANGYESTHHRKTRDKSHDHIVFGLMWDGKPLQNICKRLNINYATRRRIRMWGAATLRRIARERAGEVRDGPDT
jgi:DNA-binding CsgD family transcriptional regulator